MTTQEQTVHFRRKKRVIDLSPEIKEGLLVGFLMSLPFVIYSFIY